MVAAAPTGSDKLRTSSNPSVSSKCCLIVIDGWGLPSTDDADGKSDAIRAARTPVMDRLQSNGFLNCALAAHGRAVGLPADLMGNSEVGHLNIGAGRVVFQDIVRIEVALEEGTMASNAVLQEAWKRAKNSTGRVHFIGLVSDGGVHSHINHLRALLRYAKEAGIPSSYVHAITDGRDTAPKSATGFLANLQSYLTDDLQYGRLATVMGRYYAMDRDKRWERTKIAFEAMIGGLGGRSVSESELISTIETGYQGESPLTDEFLTPLILDSQGTIRDNDVIIFFNFRSDRMRQIVSALGLGPDQLPFTAKCSYPQGLHLVCMTRYNADFPFPVLSPPQSLDNVLAEWLSHQGLAQYHVAETEKYAHVTFFFNGGREVKFPGEDRHMVPSPRVATYDLAPAMSVAAVAEEVARAIKAPSSPYAFVMCNLAPPDMVGHTGCWEPTVKAVEATDEAIGRILAACEEAGYTLVITADHGNAERMVSESGQPHTAHTCAPVPFIIANQKAHVQYLRMPSDRPPALCDVAPTLLTLMGLPSAPEMTGTSLV